MTDVIDSDSFGVPSGRHDTIADTLDWFTFNWFTVGIGWFGGTVIDGSFGGVHGWGCTQCEGV